jgi:hypothetical protein
MVTLLAIAHATLVVNECPFCQRLPVPGNGPICLGCGANVAERAFSALVQQMVHGHEPKAAAAQLTFAAHRLTSRERNFLLELGTCLPQTLSRQGDLEDHARWRQMASLSEIRSDSIDVFYSAPGCLDCTTELGEALKCISQVLKPTGATVVGLGPGRLVDGDQAPSRKDQLDLIRHARPTHAQMWSIEVGREWIFRTWRSYGLSPCSVMVQDLASATKLEFLLGQRTANA